MAYLGKLIGNTSTISDLPVFDRSSSIDFFNKRLQSFPQKYVDQFRILESKLKALSPGSEVVPQIDPDIDQLITDGVLVQGKMYKRRGQRSRCHDNSLAFMIASKDEHQSQRLVWMTGFALSDDGLWRCHSWCVSMRPKGLAIVESTVSRLCYFGLVKVVA